MTFSDFAQMMYPFINKKGKALTTHEYVKYLICLIMEKQNTKDEQYANSPLSEYDNSTLAKYYNGGRSLSASIAKEIISHLDLDCFRDYLIDLPQDVIFLIGDALKENNITLTEFTNDCIIETQNPVKFKGFSLKCRNTHEINSIFLLLNTSYRLLLRLVFFSKI